MNNLTRRRSIKRWLVVLVALGLGGLVLSGCERLGFRNEEGAGQDAQADGRPWRTEKVFIFLYEDEKTKTKQWRVDPGHKVVSPGQTVTWRFFDCDEPAIDLSGAPLSPQNVPITGGVGRATVNGDADPGFYIYGVTCGGDPAEGGTLPGLIVDR
ncbi:MAG: hypothetical protein IH847_12085 [Acidobacteria bacterium]|nr:hypothetical protein [Acidobacteriota bacterium]